MKNNTVAILALASLVASSLATAVLVLLAGPASASGSPADKYAVINGTVDAATDHELVGSSAFPNFTTGAVDNYYSMAHSYVDNSPFAEGTASPADTGPIGQTAAAGNAQQPQYADARWPGDTGKATFGNQGGPHAVANASSFTATASAEEASNDSGGTTAIPAPKGSDFASKLHAALAPWKAKWLDRLGLKTPPVPGGGGTPKPPPVTTPSVTTPVVTVPAVTTPTLPTPTVPTLGTGSSSSPSSSRSLSSSSDGSTAVGSTTTATVDSSGNLVTSGESSLGKVSLGAGQIVIAGIDVTASVTNDGTPTDKVAVDIGAASVGGVPVTIDQDGVHVQGQGSNLPLKQADDALNGALKQAGVELYTVAPEITKGDNEETITATGVHVKFTQPVGAPGVPAQFLEHFLGEVFVDSLASPGTPFPGFNFKFSGPGGSSFGGGSGTGPGGGSASGGSGSSSIASGGTAGGSSLTSSGGASAGFPSAASTGSSSQPASGSTGGPTQAGPAAFLTSFTSKPMWLLVAYLVWQALVLGTAASLRRWGIGGGS